MSIEIETPNSPSRIALLKKRMPLLINVAQEMFEKGKISPERLRFIQEVSAEGFAYTQLKEENPDFNWIEWELGGSH